MVVYTLQVSARLQPLQVWFRARCGPSSVDARNVTSLDLEGGLGGVLEGVDHMDDFVECFHPVERVIHDCVVNKVFLFCGSRRAYPSYHAAFPVASTLLLGWSCVDCGGKRRDEGGMGGGRWGRRGEGAWREAHMTP